MRKSRVTCVVWLRAYSRHSTLVTDQFWNDSEILGKDYR